MITDVKRKILRIALIGAALIAMAMFGYEPGVAGMGILQAHWDISRKKPRYLLCGELVPYERQVQVLLLERHSIELKRVASCTATRTQWVQSNAYNEVVNAHFGFTGRRDILYSIVDELVEKNRLVRPSP